MPHKCKIWSIIFIKFVVQNWYLHPEVSSIRSSRINYTREDPILTNEEFKKIGYTTQASKGKNQPQFGHMELTIHKNIQANQRQVATTVFYYKVKKLSN